MNITARSPSVDPSQISQTLYPFHQFAPASIPYVVPCISEDRSEARCESIRPIQTFMLHDPWVIPSVAYAGRVRELSLLTVFLRSAASGMSTFELSPQALLLFDFVEILVQTVFYGAPHRFFIDQNKLLI